MSELIRMKNIKKSYPFNKEEFYAIKGIDFSVKKGEFVSIIGKSGSGKSTFMNIIGCLDMPSDGEYFLNQKSILDMSESSLSRIRNETIGFVFQSFNLVSSLTALENVELPLIYRGINKKKRRKLSCNALLQVGLKDKLNHYPSWLSGGQQQKVAIARAIVGSPDLILADEPTGSLDSASSEAVLDVICSLRNENRTIILISHDISVARLADRMITIKDGVIDNLN